MWLRKQRPNLERNSNYYFCIYKTGVVVSNFNIKKCTRVRGKWTTLLWSQPSTEDRNKKYLEELTHEEISTLSHTCYFWHLKLEFQFTPESCLFEYDLGSPKTILLNNLSGAARLLIAKHWKTQIIPSISEWRFKCQYCLLTCKLPAIKSVKNILHTGTW